jgi:hypothetical protein
MRAHEDTQCAHATGARAWLLLPPPPGRRPLLLTLSRALDARQTSQPGMEFDMVRPTWERGGASCCAAQRGGTDAHCVCVCVCV